MHDVAAVDVVRNALWMARRMRVALASHFKCLTTLDHVTRQEVEAMGRVKKAGDDAVQLGPGIQTEPDELMRDLVLFLKVVERLRLA